MRVAFTFLLLAASLNAAALSPDTHETVVRDLAQGRADDAMQMLAPATTAGSRDAEAQQLLCRLNLQIERWDEAITACEAAVSLDSTSNNHLWYARALGEKADRASFVKAYGLAKRVRTEFETAVALDPGNASALSDLGQFYLEAPAIVGGGKDKADSVAGKLDAVDRARAEQLRGYIAASDKDAAGAQEHFRQAITAAERPAAYWMALGSFLQRQNDASGMQQAIRSGLASRGAQGEPLVDAASLLLRSGQDAPGAIRLLRQYLASPDKSEDAPAFRVHLQLAALLEKQGDAAGAAREIQAASAIASIYHPNKPIATNTGR